MTLQFIEGFEDGIVANNILGKWSSGESKYNVDVLYGRHGLGARNNATSAGLKKSAEAHATMVLGVACRFQSFYTGTGVGSLYRTFAFYGDNGSREHITVQVRPSDMLVFRGGTQVASFAHSIAVGTWYFIEIKVVLSDTAGSVEARIDGASIGTFSGDTRNAGTNPTLDAVDVYNYQVNTNYTWVDFDDIYIVNGAGTVDNDFLGDHRVDLALPNGNGARSGLVGSDGDQLDNYLLVDENPPATADYVGSATDGAGDTYAFGNAPAGRAIAGVQTVMYAAKTDTGAKSMRQLARIGGVDYPGDAKVLSTGYQAYLRTMGVSPASGADWTEAEFNGAEFGAEVQP